MPRTKRPETYLEQARRHWPRALWIEGEGVGALVSTCPPGVTVQLYPTWREAWAARRPLDRMGCGTGCEGKPGHEVHNLDAMASLPGTFEPHLRHV